MHDGDNKSIKVLEVLENESKMTSKRRSLINLLSHTFSTKMLKGFCRRVPPYLNVQNLNSKFSPTAQKHF